MQDMGNVGSIVINFINESLKTKKFRISKVLHPTYVIDKGGYVTFQMKVGNTNTQRI